MQRLILAMAERDGIEACGFEFVMVAGHFLARDENIFTFFEGVQVKPPEQSGEQYTAACMPETHPSFAFFNVFVVVTFCAWGKALTV